MRWCGKTRYFSQKNQMKNRCGFFSNNKMSNSFFELAVLGQNWSFHGWHNENRAQVVTHEWDMSMPPGGKKGWFWLSLIRSIIRYVLGMSPPSFVTVKCQFLLFNWQKWCATICFFSFFRCKHLNKQSKTNVVDNLCTHEGASFFSICQCQIC